MRINPARSSDTRTDGTTLVEEGWNELSTRFVRFNEDGTWEKPQLPDGIKQLVLVTHDESTLDGV